jgi:MFS family permease
MTTAIRRTARNTFRSLRVRNYRLYFLGQIVSVTGTWIQSIAQVWLVLKLSGSGLALGITTGLQFLPILLFGPWGGVVADRFDKRKILMWTQAASGVMAGVLGILVMTGAVRLWMVYVLAFVLGLITLIDNPTRQSFVVEMVGPDDLQNGISLNSAVFTATRIVGPAIAGLLILTVGLALCFLLNAASYIAVIAGLALMRPADLRRQALVPRAKGQVRAGLRYVWSTPRLRWPLLLMAVIYTLSFNFSVLLPLLARNAFHGGPGLYSLFFSMMGLGALIGALTMANQRRPSQRILAAAGLGFGIAVVEVAISPVIGVAVAGMILVGFTSMAFMTTSNSMLQFATKPSMRGRVMAVYAMVFLGSTAIGGPLSGWVAGALGARTAFGLAGGIAAVCALAAFWALRALQGRGRGTALVRRVIAAPDASPLRLGPEAIQAEPEPLSA